MRILFLDCFSGISGDMTVGALCDLGVQPSAFEWELGKLELGDFHMHFERQQRRGVEGIKFDVCEGTEHTHGHGKGHDHGEDHSHGHSHQEEGHHGHKHAHPHEHKHAHAHVASEPAEHSHGAHHHRTFASIRALIEQSELSDFVKTHAISIFRRVAIAEGKIHGKPPEEVGFHEVGAIDSIVDIICTCVGIEQLGVQAVQVSALHDGRGWVKCAHGLYPVPCMATLEILKGIPLGQIDEPVELITPTGAAIVAEFAQSFGVMPRLRVEKIGYGVGSRDLPQRPNVLRAVLGELDTPLDGPYLSDTITRIETNLDDLSPEITGAVLAKLIDAGALDAFLTPIQMKKNRPAVQLTVLCEEANVQKLADLLFTETSSFGIRMDQMERWKLDRRFETVKTAFGEITVKLGLRTGTVVQIAPEFESCRAASEQSGQPLRAVYAAALDAFRNGA